jgi:hypothetical protein
LIRCFNQLSKTWNRRHTMRLLVLAAAAALVVTGSAMADDSVQSPVKGSHHHHYRDANASVASDAAPADVLSAHELHVKNLRDSGYNPSNDFTSAGTIKAN